MSNHSRVGRLGAGASHLTEEEVLDRLGSACVHISVEPDLPGALLTLRLLVTTLRRMPGRIHLDASNLNTTHVAELREAAERRSRCEQKWSATTLQCPGHRGRHRDDVGLRRGVGVIGR